MTATVADLLAQRGDDESLGLVAGDECWSWAEVVGESRRYAAALAGLRGDGPFHVGILAENTPEFLFTMFGAALAGAVTVGVNSTRRGAELARDITHTDCRIIATEAGQVDLLTGLDLNDAEIVSIDAPRWAELLARGEHAAQPAATVAADDLFVLLFTSGSTGAPKAVRMTHGRATRAALAATWFTADSVLYCTMPLFHGNSLNAIVFPALATGATIALRRRFSASEFLPDCRRYHATFFSTVGRALAYVLATPEHPDDREHEVQYGLSPEASPTDMAAFTRRFGIPLVAGYGSSENAIVMVPAPGQPKDALGVPQEGIDAAIIDPDTGAEAATARLDSDGRLLNPTEAIGEIVGRNVADRFEGYYNNPEADAERIRDGMYLSGDLGYRDGRGLFFFAGRRGEWLRVDGENFTAGLVERVLGRFPGVSAVAVYAVPDERTADDQPMAAVELVADAEFDAEAFTRFCADEPDLGTKWAPRYVRIGRLPVGGTNKVDRRALRSERWESAAPVWWRPDRTSPYRLMTDDDRRALDEQFEAHGRAGALRRPG
ncbi:MAG TPA: AMP-binding protein [Acidimicrobiia bacterium]|nr:AMP-binding protein [Acidimicrobiia bacterium]